LAKAETVYQAEGRGDPRPEIASVAAHEVVRADEHDAQCDRRLDDRRWRRDDIQCGSESVMLCPIVNAVTITTQRAPRCRP
jgi:hypothetical protein